MILRPSAALLVLLFLALTAADEGYIPCENGSEYIEVFLSDGTEDFYCNCTAANTDAVSFAGTFCQYESTSFCQKEPTVSGFQHFCVNGGVCTGSDRLEDGCDCPQDYHGLRCEYQIGVDNVDTTCELACFNDGNCYEGIKEYGAMLDPFRDGLTHFLNELHVDLEYCICPPGYLGVRCEYQYQVCADAELICLHGSSCDLLSNNDDGNDDGNDGGLYYYCNCQTSVMLTAGEYCEYIVSSVCGAGSGEFCTNDGACVTFGDFTECLCPPGFEGQRCEFLTPDAPICTLNCRNGGICVLEYFPDEEMGVAYEYCDCPPEYDGDICQQYLGECVFQCQNGGECVIERVCDVDVVGCDDDGFSIEQFCDCPPGYVGQACETTCSTVRGHSENANNNGDALYCNCPAGFGGLNCELECDLNCLNGGRCSLWGLVDEEQGTNADSAYCDCPQGFFGAGCEFRDIECGEITCSNGSECVEASQTAIARAAGDIEHYCDCTAASTEITYFAGRSCQYESTVICSSGADSPNGPRFCVNGGGCLDESKGGCECIPGFFGSRCEFSFEEFEDGFAKCGLECLNGGTCVEGFKTLGGVFEPFAGSVQSLFNQSSVDFEHCNCPVGFLGARCEFEYKLCGGAGDHICFHGSSCVEANGEFKCDCNEASTFAAGLYCQHLATEVCDETSGVFCTNGGACRDNINGCDCPAGFFGEQCERYVATEAALAGAPSLAPSVPSTEDASVKIGNVWDSCLIFLVTVWCIFG